MIPLPAAYSSSCDIASKTRLLLFSEARGRLPNNFTFFLKKKKKQHYLEKKMKLIQSFSSCEIDGQRWHEGLEGTKQIEHQVDFVISHPSNVEDVIFISTFLII